MAVEVLRDSGRVTIGFSQSDVAVGTNDVSGVAPEPGFLFGFAKKKFCEHEPARNALVAESLTRRSIHVDLPLHRC